MENINKTFGLRLKMLRDQAGLRQEDVGEWFKMQKSTVSQWENGRFPHASIIATLADRFNVSVDYLLGRTTLVRETASSKPSVDEVISRARKISLSEKQQAALCQYENMTPDEQQQRLTLAIEKLKTLSASEQEALVKIIDSLHSRQ